MVAITEVPGSILFAAHDFVVGSVVVAALVVDSTRAVAFVELHLPTCFMILSSVDSPFCYRL